MTLTDLPTSPPDAAPAEGSEAEAKAGTPVPAGPSTRTPAEAGSARSSGDVDRSGAVAAADGARSADRGAGAEGAPGAGAPAAADADRDGTTAGPRPADAVGWADGLREDVRGRIGELLDAGDAPALRDVYVGWVAAIDAAGCPVRYRASGADGWGFPGWAPALAAGAVGRAALARHLDRTASAFGDPPLPQPLDAVRDWMREAQRAPGSAVAEWIAELGQAGDRASVAVTAANATRWLAGLVRVMGWPLPERFALVVDDAQGPYGRRWPKRWRPVKGSPVCVASSPDATLGKVAPSGRFDLLIHRPSSPGDSAVGDRAAFEAAAGALANGIVPAHIVVTTADTGEQARFPVSPDLLGRGADLIVGVVRQRLVAAAEDQPDDALASPACRYCPELDDCATGQTWLTGPGRWRGGLPVLAAPT